MCRSKSPEQKLGGRATLLAQRRNERRRAACRPCGTTGATLCKLSPMDCAASRMAGSPEGGKWRNVLAPSHPRQLAKVANHDPRRKRYGAQEADLALALPLENFYVTGKAEIYIAEDCNRAFSPDPTLLNPIAKSPHSIDEIKILSGASCPRSLFSLLLFRSLMAEFLALRNTGA